MMRVGLTGGYATGKSFVAAELTRLGCHVIYADALGHQTLEPDGEAYRPVVERFGPKILDGSGCIDRKRLGALVFSSPPLLAELSAIIHPAVFRLEEQLMAQFAEEDPDGIVVVEAAILIETGRFRSYDRLILTVCDEATQIRRGTQRDGLTVEQVRARLKEQMLLSEKKRFADYIIETGGEPEQTLRQTRDVYRALTSIQTKST